MDTATLGTAGLIMCGVIGFIIAAWIETVFDLRKDWIEKHPMDPEGEAR